MNFVVLWLSFVFCFCFALFLYQRWLLTIRLRQAYWNLTLRIRWPILCSGSTGIKPRNPTFDPWLTLGRQSPVQVGCLPTLIMVMQGPPGCCSLLPASLTFIPPLVTFIIFFLNPSSYFFFSQVHMPQPFHNDTFYPIGQVCSPVGKMSAVTVGCRCLACSTHIYSDWLRGFGNNAMITLW